MMASLIPISGGRKGYAIVNDDIAEEVRRHPWRIVGTCRYPITTLRDPSNPNGKIVTMHRFVYKLLYGFYPENGEEIDKSFQQANIGRKNLNASGFKSVSCCKFYTKRSGTYFYWVAEMTKDGVKILRQTFPYTEDGWRQAAKTINDKYADVFPGVAVPNPDWASRPYPFKV